MRLVIIIWAVIAVFSRGGHEPPRREVQRPPMPPDTQKKIDAIFDWVMNTTNVQRMGEAERNKLIAEGKAKATTDGDDMGWLFKPNLEEAMDAWLSKES